MDAFWTDVVAVGFLLWWLATVVHQAPPGWWLTVVRHDYFRLVPSWTFFAPRPGRRDNHLIYRDCQRDGPDTWREVELGETKLSWRCLWNPYRFRQKALMDLVNGLLKARRQYRERQFDPLVDQISVPYLAMLAWVGSQPVETRPCLRQFAVVASSGHGQHRALRMLYLSQVHSVADADGR